MDFEAYKNLNLNDERQSPYLTVTILSSDDNSIESVKDTSKLSIESTFEELIFSKTTKLKPKIVYSEYEYIYEKTYGNKKYWRCSYVDLSAKKYCKARIHTGLNNKLIKVTKTQHIHEMDPDVIDSKLLTCEIKERGKDTAENPRRIITDALTKLLFILNIKIPNKLSLTYSGNQFVFFDGGQDDENRIIVLATDENLNVLKNIKIWCVDGTFEITPTLFYQLFTINVIESGRNIPLLYAFLSNKNQDTYFRLFESLSTRLNSSPDYIFCDFEKAILNSLEKFFPSSKLSGCWFHLADNLFKHVQSNGLVKEFRCRSNFSLRKCYKYVKFLAFVPAHDNFKSIQDYFEKFYIGLPMKNDTTKRAVPQYPIKLWNVYKRIVKDLPRTNNHIEAWHRSLKQDIESHPTFIKLLKHLLREQRLAEKLIDEVRVGIFGRRSNKEVKKDIAVKNLLEQLPIIDNAIHEWADVLIFRGKRIHFEEKPVECYAEVTPADVVFFETIWASRKQKEQINEQASGKRMPRSRSNHKLEKDLSDDEYQMILSRN
ncbi:hypothetical protein BpHYR1_039360 [Brachionus plicatilis]|uniref:MULE transposase domain-containing protein n=1 Tax=Brachionus plicatilis TaxID=10195 RepID=A0A3M7QXL3_BRAPC|nr:hypothetical protein BpHYR1_039360 [Brachionus plicatilis]